MLHQSKAKSQRIAAWELLYRVQHPGRYVSRLQTILHSDIAVKIPRHEDDRRSTKHHCDGSFFRPSSESGSAAVNEDQIHGPFTSTAYRKRTSFGLARNRVRKYHSLG
jgi:hypothetical protein